MRLRAAAGAARLAAAVHMARRPGAEWSRVPCSGASLQEQILESASLGYKSTRGFRHF